MAIVNVSVDRWGNGFRDILLQFLINNGFPFIKHPQHMDTFYDIYTTGYCSGMSVSKIHLPDCDVLVVFGVFDHAQGLFI